jgi:phosphatidylserine/phosphatidylglycerophosphate/cardiolipin synthase-like enzyme
MQISTEFINSSEKSLKFIFYSISPLLPTAPLEYKLWWHSLLSAAKNGIDCKIILSSWPENNPQNAATMRAKLMLESAGWQVKLTKLGIIMHPKAMLFDDKKLIIGSHNATEAGFSRTKNISIVATSDAAIGQFNDYFDVWW